MRADLVARLGGDEFAILIEPLSSQEEAIALTAEILAVLRQPVHLEESQVALSASVGVTIWNQGYGTPQQMLRDADTAMYRAKKNGRDRAVFFDAKARGNVDKVRTGARSTVSHFTSRTAA